MSLYFSPHFTNPRTLASDMFQRQYERAQVSSLWKRIFGHAYTLPSLPRPTAQELQQMTYVGVTDIQVQKITGSLNRSDDFDPSFRPLKSHLRDRWVNVYLQTEQGNCPAIQVMRVGEKYYVIDGHHRVSVASFLGEAYITAEIWVYNPKKVEVPAARPSSVLQPATCC